MTRRSGLTLLLGLLLASPALADVTVVDENFDNYADQGAFQAVWTPDNGSGLAPSGLTKGILIPAPPAFAPFFDPANVPPYNEPYANPPGTQGKAVAVGLSGINEYNGPVLPGAPALADLVPSATQSIRLTADLFDDGSLSGPEPTPDPDPNTPDPQAGYLDHRTSVGLRSDSVPRDDEGNLGTNFLEMGFYNDAATDPSDADTGHYVESGFGYRLTIFQAPSEDSNLRVQPNWQYFKLDPALERDNLQQDPDGTGPITETVTAVTQVDVDAYAEEFGLERWHTFSATIGVDTVTMTLDLFRDGLNNATGQPGVDATDQWDLAPNNDPDEPHPFDPFNSLRIGAPSGAASLVYAGVDNVLLELVDVTATPTDNADFDGDGDVDGRDFLAFQRNLGISNGSATLAQGDANGDGNVTSADLGIFKQQFGEGTAAAPAVAAIPEPTTVALGALAILAGLAAGRRRK